MPYPVSARGKSVGASVFSYDSIPSIASIYSTRRTLTAYTGNLIRIRRSSDNTEQDFGALANWDLDIASVASFIGGGSGFVVTWYDQSGNGRNVTQATAANQPAYVASTQNSKPGTRYDGTNDELVSSSFSSGAAVTMITLIQRGWGTMSGNAYRSYYSRGYSGSANAGMAFMQTGASEVGWTAKDQLAFGSGYNSNPRAFGAAAAGTDYRVISAQLGSSLARVRSNGVAISTTESVGAVTTTGSVTSRVGASGAASQFWDGDICEVVFVDAALSAAKVAEAEMIMNGYWRVY